MIAYTKAFVKDKTGINANVFIILNPLPKRFRKNKGHFCMPLCPICLYFFIIYKIFITIFTKKFLSLSEKNRTSVSAPIFFQIFDLARKPMFLP